MDDRITVALRVSQAASLHATPLIAGVEHLSIWIDAKDSK